MKNKIKLLNIIILIIIIILGIYKYTLIKENEKYIYIDNIENQYKEISNFGNKDFFLSNGNNLLIYKNNNSNIFLYLYINDIINNNGEKYNNKIVNIKGNISKYYSFNTRILKENELIIKYNLDIYKYKDIINKKKNYIDNSKTILEKMEEGNKKIKYAYFGKSKRIINNTELINILNTNIINNNFENNIEELLNNKNYDFTEELFIKEINKNRNISKDILIKNNEIRKIKKHLINTLDNINKLYYNYGDINIKNDLGKYKNIDIIISKIFLLNFIENYY